VIGLSISAQRCCTTLFLSLSLMVTNTLAQSGEVSTQFQYDDNGNLTQSIDRLQQITSFTIDPLNRVQQQQQPAPVTGAARPTIAYTYDGRDQLSTATDPRNLVTGYTNDGLGNQTALTSPDTGTTNRTYDLGGNLTSSTDARGQITRYTYDALNRITGVTYGSGTPSASTATFEYDGGTAGAPNAIGHLTWMVDDAGDTRYNYNGFGRVLNKVQYVNDSGVAFTLAHTYGNSGAANGKLQTLTYPSGNQITYSYDAAGRISDLTLNATDSSGTGTAAASTPLLSGIGYQPFGAPVSWTWGNSSATSVNTYARSIDTDGRITRFPLGSGVNNGTLRALTYDAASRITAMTHNGTGTGAFTPTNFDQQFGYDNLNRLVSVTSAGGNQTYAYDATGNRTAAVIGSTGYTNAISTSSNRLASTTGPAPAKTNQYDATGNLVNDGSIGFTFNARGCRDSAVIGTDTVRYQYNGLGQRVLKSGPDALVPSTQQQYVYDEAGHLIGEYDATGALIQETVYLGDIPVAALTQSIDTSGPTPITSTNVNYIYADQINTPRVITQASDNQIVWRWDAADPFGVLQPDEDPSALGGFTYNLRFPGQLYDRETNLHYNWFRDYDPQQGRYVESDPIGLAGALNTYAYGNNRPTQYIDPAGLCPMCLIPAIPYIPEAIVIVSTWWASRPATGDAGSTYWPGPRPDETYGDGRKYGRDGRPEIDYDHSHPGHHGGIGDHIHDWIDGERSKDPRPYSPWPRPAKPQPPRDNWCPIK
jgi:RHS repeat-associated protein